MITATLARQHGIKGPVVVVQVVDATLDTERHGATRSDTEQWPSRGDT